MALVLSENAIADVADLYGDGSLLLGGEPLSRAEWDALFSKWKVQHVVRCVGSEVEPEMGLDKSTRGPGFRLLHLKLHDIVGFDIKKYFISSGKFMEEAFVVTSSSSPASPPSTITTAISEEGSPQKGPIFVHCQAGVSRSVTIILSYLLQKRGMSIKEGLEFVRKTRSMARPNTSFLSQLGDLEREVFIASLDCKLEEEEKQNLISEFRPSVDVGEYVIDAAMVRWGSICPKSVMNDLYYSTECGQNAQKLNLMISEWYEETENCRAVLAKVKGSKPKQSIGGGQDKKLFAVLDREVEATRAVWRECGKDFDKTVTDIKDRSDKHQQK